MITESGNMLIMSLAHARATGDASLINGYVCGFQLRLEDAFDTY